MKRLTLIDTLLICGVLVFGISCAFGIRSSTTGREKVCRIRGETHVISRIHWLHFSAGKATLSVTKGWESVTKDKPDFDGVNCWWSELQ